MIFVGVDPGKHGAIVAVREPGPGGEFFIRVAPTPILYGGKAGRDEYDLAAIALELRHLRALGGPDPFVTVEKAQPLPPQLGGSLANFQRGVGRGWEWLLVGMSLPYQLVAPRVWQKVMHAGTPDGDTKQRSIMAAQRLFPSVSLLRTPRCKGPDDGIAEALLLAEFGRRVRAGAAA